jgi:hypothetical protein
MALLIYMMSNAPYHELKSLVYEGQKASPESESDKRACIENKLEVIVLAH